MLLKVIMLIVVIKSKIINLFKEYKISIKRIKVLNNLYKILNIKIIFLIFLIQTNTILMKKLRKYIREILVKENLKKN